MMPPDHPRMDREARTIRCMIDIYCRDKHASASHGLCAACSELRDYALARLDRCPFQEDKPACADCTVHCYKPDRRQQVREVMRYAGPRMFWRHPILALAHWFVDRRREPPTLAGRPTRP